jgi:hypothetical protein
MIDCSTKIFGEIILDETKEYEKIYIKYNESKLTIGIPNCFMKNSDELKMCIEIMDKYLEINEIAKNEVVEKHNKENVRYSGRVKHFFEYIFHNYGNEERFELFGTNIFKDIDVKYIFKKIDYPDLLFVRGNHDDNKIEFWLNYIVSKNDHIGPFKEILGVQMDQRFIIMDIETFGKCNYLGN